MNRKAEKPVKVVIFDTTIPDPIIHRNPTFGIGKGVHCLLEKASQRKIDLMPFGGHLHGIHHAKFMEAAHKADVIILGDENYDIESDHFVAAISEGSVKKISEELMQKNKNVFIKGWSVNTNYVVDFSAEVIESFEEPKLINAIKSI